ncbi:hypothetical protein JRQ81_018213, partial [Phrynocephalus forsythii]
AISNFKVDDRIDSDHLPLVLEVNLGESVISAGEDLTILPGTEIGASRIKWSVRQGDTM